jgi:hypothetical protein
MQFYYCPKDDTVRPKRRFADNRCDICRQECVTIDVKRSVHGYIMYALDIAAGIMIALYLAHHQFNADFASFVGTIDETLYIVVMFGLILISFVFSGLDIGRTQAEALRIARERKGRIQ